MNANEKLLAHAKIAAKNNMDKLLYQFVYSGDLVALGINKAGTHYIQLLVLMPDCEAELRHVGPDIVKVAHRKADDDYFILSHCGRRYLAGNGSHVCDIGLTIKTEGVDLTKAADGVTYFHKPERAEIHQKPRIVGVISRTDSSAPTFEFVSILKSSLGYICDRLHYSYGDMMPGFGRCLRTKSSYTYEGVPLDYREEPLLIEFPDDNEIINQFRYMSGPEGLILLRRISISDGTMDIIGALDEEAESALA